MKWVSIPSPGDLPNPEIKPESSASQANSLLAEPPGKSCRLQSPSPNIYQVMAPHSSILAWRIPWIEEPGGLQSMWLQRVRHNWVTNTFTFLYTLGLHLGRQVMSIWVGMHRRVMTQNIHLQIQLQPVHMLIFETLKKVQKAFTNTYKKQHRL